MVNHLVDINLTAYALAAIAARLPDLRLLAQDPPEFVYLRERLRAVADGGREWAQPLAAYLEQPADEDKPLLGLARSLDLSSFEVLSVALAASVEAETMLGRALAQLQAPLGGSRPTLALLAQTYGAAAGADDLDAIQALADGAAVRSGLLALHGDGPLPERTVEVPAHLGLALAGRDGRYPGATIGVEDVPPVPLPPSILAEAQRRAMGLRAGPDQALVLRSGSQAEARWVAHAVAEGLAARPCFVEIGSGATGPLTGFAPWLLLRDLIPVFCLSLAPGERWPLPALPHYHGPVLVICGPDGSIEAAGGGALSWTLPVPSRTERLALWEQAIGPGPLARDLAAYHRHASGRIAHLGRLAGFEAARWGRTAPAQADLAAVAWTGEGGGLDALAQALPDPIPDEALVLPDPLRHDLDLLLRRCRARDALVEGLGPSAQARYHPGVRALLVGPSGTGKTLAAGWLASRLGLPLYRVDLASVTSKYIGETEKNLAQLLARAEQSEVVLLFDEADSLFGKRTDVKEANDRFANAQTNYLLQRIEAYDGITLLTSNSRARFDPAFARRLDMIIEFPAPGPEERRALWLSHLGEGHALTPLQINQLAIAADVTGGHIRNAVLTASVLAFTEDRPISYADIVTGLAGEYRKLARPLPGELA